MWCAVRCARERLARALSGVWGVIGSMHLVRWTHVP
jgi:hypothetical protein